MALAPDEQIRHFISRFAAPPDEQVAAFVAQGKKHRIEKGHFLTRLGDENHRLAFVHSGLLRFHVVHPDTGADVTKDFVFAPSFAVSFGSAVLGQPARVAVSAVEDCVATVWPFDLWTQTLEKHLEWQRFGRCMAELLYVRKEDRELAFLLQSADERYDALSMLFPADIRQIPQHLIASYMGIAPESFSRLKKRRTSRETGVP